MLYLADTVVLHKDPYKKILVLEFDHGCFRITPKSGIDYSQLADSLSEYVIDKNWIERYKLEKTINTPHLIDYFKKQRNKITRVYCQNGWVDIGTQVYLVPLDNPKLKMLGEYQTRLTAGMDIYRNHVFTDVNSAIKFIRSKENIWGRICSLFN